MKSLFMEGNTKMAFMSEMRHGKVLWLPWDEINDILFLNKLVMLFPRREIS